MSAGCSPVARRETASTSRRIRPARFCPSFKGLWPRRSGWSRCFGRCCTAEGSAGSGFRPRVGGEFQRGRCHDIDVIAIGSLGLAELSPVLDKAEERLVRPVNANVYSPQEFASKLAAKNHFLRSVLDKEKLFVVGKPHDLERIAGRKSRRGAPTSKQELDDLRNAVDRNLRDAAIPQLSADNRFGVAYEAALLLGKIAVACAGIG